MGTVSYDMVGVKGRMERGLYDHEELERAVKFMKRFKIAFGKGPRPYSDDELLRECCKMALIVRDLMVGNPILADAKAGKAQGFKADVEFAQGANALAAGTQGQRQWTDLYPNYDLAESVLGSSFDWNGSRAPYIVATENDSKNGIGMLIASLLSGAPQLFADIRTNWTPASIKAATGTDVAKLIPGGIIDKRNSGAGALDYAVDVFSLVKGGNRLPVQDVMAAIADDTRLQRRLMEAAVQGTVYMAAVLEYFRGDGLSSHFRTPGGIPMTAYRYNAIGETLTCSVVEGQTVQLPRKVADHINEVTDRSWPETYWAPRGMTSFEYMSRIGPNHDANSFGLIGADLITVNAMLRIPVDLHNVPCEDIFRPTLWDRFGGDDFRACAALGPLYT
ncbi:MAG: L-fucose isomerase [Lentisphaerae bacterium ADurb.BinA184]|nr:MAG: L-fucose isomerase [Lentisphaerae bacterium ADurb.BinA184]